MRKLNNATYYRMMAASSLASKAKNKNINCFASTQVCNLMSTRKLFNVLDYIRNRLTFACTCTNGSSSYYLVLRPHQKYLLFPFVRPTVLLKFLGIFFGGCGYTYFKYASLYKKHCNLVHVEKSLLFGWVSLLYVFQRTKAVKACLHCKLDPMCIQCELFELVSI